MGKKRGVYIYIYIHFYAESKKQNKAKMKTGIQMQRRNGWLPEGWGSERRK